jgi:hypothetical protein
LVLAGDRGGVSLTLSARSRLGHFESHNITRRTKSKRYFLTPFRGGVVGFGNRGSRERPGSRNEGLDMLITRVGADDLIVLSVIPPIVAGMQHLLAWLHYRRINRDAPLTAYQRRLTMYLDFFILGMGYSMVPSAAFRWPTQAWIGLSGGWALSLFWIYRKRRERERKVLPNVPLG